MPHDLLVTAALAAVVVSSVHAGEESMLGGLLEAHFHQVMHGGPVVAAGSGLLL
jgi:hypothetical protein